MRQIIDLNYNWLFSKTFSDEHLKNYFEVNEFDTIDLPHNAVDIPYNNFDVSTIQGTFTYKKIINIESKCQDKDIILTFEGISNMADVFINDDYISTHRGSYTPFSVNITDYVKYGENNMITVIVDSHENVFIPPFGGSVDYLAYSGIYREVRLEVLDKERIIDYFIKTPNPLKSNFVSLDLNLSTDYGILEINISTAEAIIVSTKFRVQAKTMSVNIDIGQKNLWDLDDPFLYNIEIRLIQNERLIDCVKNRFGFREIIFKSDGFYLNGKKIKLIGLNRHQSYPYIGYAMPKSIQEEDVDILKNQLNCNIVRSSHYPPSSHFLRRCDEVGLLVMEELPGWQHIGNEEWQTTALEHLKEMIIRDRNHPCVILWGVRINESSDNDPFYTKTNDLARSLDPTRPTGGVRNLAKSSLLEDVYTYNDFIHKGDNLAISPKRTITKKKNPYLITEYNGHMFPTKSSDNQMHKTEHALRYARIINEASNPKNKIAGAIGWCMNDYNTHPEFGSGDLVCYHGVLDMYRLPKLASFVFASLQNGKPIMEVATRMNRGDYSASTMEPLYCFTNMDYIKIYRNGELIGSFYPDKKGFPYLKHPPIVIKELIGDLLINNEHFSPLDSKKVKEIIREVKLRGANLHLKTKLKTLGILKKYHLTYDEGVKLIYKYLDMSTKAIYRFEGYRENEKIITKTFEELKATKLMMELPRKVMNIEATYDAMRIIVRKLDQNNIPLPYSSTVIQIKVSGEGHLIGPSKRSLINGEAAFYIRSTSSSGVITIEVTDEESKITEMIVVK